MCLSTAYELGGNGERKLLCEYVSIIKVAGDTITLTDLMGQELSVTGALESVDLVKNAITISPLTGGGSVEGAPGTAGVSAGGLAGNSAGTGRKKYEMIREIFNSCSGNQMRDVDVQEIEIGDLDAYLAELYSGEHFTSAKTVREDGVVVFDIDASGLAQRVSFTEIE
jgi:predicted RNA-binding protein